MNFRIRTTTRTIHHTSCKTGADLRRYILFNELAAVEIWFRSKFISVTKPSASFSREVCWSINTVSSYLLSYLCSSLSDPISRDCSSPHSQCPSFLRARRTAHSHRQHESVLPGTLGLFKTCFVSSTAAMNSSKTLKISLVGDSIFRAHLKLLPMAMFWVSSKWTSAVVKTWWLSATQGAVFYCLRTFVLFETR